MASGLGGHQGGAGASPEGVVMTEPDYVEELCMLLARAKVKPYINTAYLSERGRVIAFRKRAAAWLTGRRAPFRHYEG